MLFKDKIIAAIKAKFPAINLSKKRLDAIADSIEKKVIDDETKIDAALDDFNHYNPLADMAKADDTMRNLNAKVKELEKPKDNKEKTETTTTEPVDDGTPSWAKALIEQNKTLASDLAALKGDKIANSIRSEATKKLSEIPESYWSKRALPEKAEDLDAFVTDVQTDYGAFTQELTNKGLAKFQAPAAGSGGAATAASGGAGGKGTAVVSPEVKAYGDQQKALREAQAKNRPTI
jgi:hypothetical protein